MIKIYFSKFELNPKVLEESEYPIYKEIYTRNPLYKYYKLPKVKGVFIYYIILYLFTLLYAFIELLNSYFNVDFISKLIDEIPDTWEIVTIVAVGLPFFSLFSFIPTLHNYLDAYFESKKMNKLLKNNVLSSTSYQDYLTKPRY